MGGGRWWWGEMKIMTEERTLPGYTLLIFHCNFRDATVINVGT